MENKKRNVKKFCFVYHTNTNISNRRKRQNESKFKPFQHKFRLQPSSSINSRQHQDIADLTSVSVRKQQCIASSTPVDSKQKQDRASSMFNNSELLQNITSTSTSTIFVDFEQKNVESTTHFNFEKQQDSTNLVHVDFGQQQEHVSSIFINTERLQNITNTTLVNFEQNDVENPTHSNFGKQQDIMNPVHVNSGQHQNKDSSTLINFEKQRSMTSVAFANCEVNLPLDIISPEFQFSNIESILSGPSETQQLNSNKSATNKSLNQEVEACYCDYRWVTPPHYGTLDWMNNSINTDYQVFKESPLEHSSTRLIHSYFTDYSDDQQFEPLSLKNIFNQHINHTTAKEESAIQANYNENNMHELN
ncbi:hypothetical protein F8M41_006259 [Gigaspora margarita]|uniref:Uncharacterized protein n=1 Tax=Gigaspora margarita TaxID=4874 RepID=A0A8H4ERD8_GIGMA|nr:hypothetical protein F8M41_006259 [Gigaspora margarita]